MRILHLLNQKTKRTHLHAHTDLITVLILGNCVSSPCCFMSPRPTHGGRPDLHKPGAGNVVSAQKRIDYLLSDNSFPWTQPVMGKQEFHEFRFLEENWEQGS